MTATQQATQQAAQNPSQERTREERFIDFLEKLNPEHGANRKAFAELRRSLAFDLGTHIPSFAYVEPSLSDKFNDRKRQMYYLIAGLYALHPKQSGLEFGQALALLKDKRDSDSLEKRFLALLSTDEDSQLAHYLRQMINLLKQEDIGLNYAKLLKDLFAWRHFDKYIQRRWAQHYYRYQALQSQESQKSQTNDAPNAQEGN